MKESNFGDPHNYGKKVTREYYGNQAVFVKPRTLVWEQIFFGSDSVLRSPLSRILVTDHQKLGQISSSLESAIFGLKFSHTSESTPNVYEITKDPQPNCQPLSLFQFGLLLSYCYTFGIQDLHNDNVICCEGHLQVVDTEIVLSKLLLPNETLLLPTNETSFKNCGLNELVRCDFLNDKVDGEIILRGFVLGMCELINLNTALKTILNRKLTSELQTPIRVILRATKKYYQYEYTQFDQPLFSGEIEQLKRGDIPYFFKFLNDNTLFQYTNKIGAFKEVEVPRNFQSAVDRVALNPSELLEISRLQSLTSAGAMFLIRHLFQPNWIGKLNLGKVDILVTSTEIHISTSWGNFFTNRFKSKS